ncbi:hypothetical protein B0H14DRAFT_3787654 [Mycena olivaceomarginata]|nr:hypothetical protein B0H14DRAFT_3787654 [Mycena olivaceomarginata]
MIVEFAREASNNPNKTGKSDEYKRTRGNIRDFYQNKTDSSNKLPRKFLMSQKLAQYKLEVWQIEDCFKVLSILQLPELGLGTGRESERVRVSAREPPFRSIQPHIAVILQILDQKRPPRPSGPPDGTRAISDRLWAIVEACWAHKPSDRPDIDKASGLIVASP